MSKVVLLQLESPDESALVSLALSRWGWSPVSSYLPLESQRQNEPLLLVITDRAAVIEDFMDWPGGPPIFFVTDDNDDFVAAAWRAGADMVIRRPIEADVMFDERFLNTLTDAFDRS